MDDTNPTELEDGYYVFDITQAESNGDMILIAPASSTPNIQVIGVPGRTSTWCTDITSVSIEISLEDASMPVEGVQTLGKHPSRL